MKVALSGPKWCKVIPVSGPTGPNSHGTRRKRKKMCYGEFFDFLQKNVPRIKFQEIKIRPWKGFEKMRFYIIGV